MLHPLLSHHLSLHAPQRFASSLALLQPGAVAFINLCLT
jgi:hypothetical protein